MSITATVNETARAATTTVQSGPRLDRLPISSFHKRIFWLIGAGMFFDGYDLYVGTSVLGATLSSGFSTLAQNAQFVSSTFIGMTIGALIAGFLGDAYGRRFTYQFNLLLFGLASLGAALAPDDGMADRRALPDGPRPRRRDRRRLFLAHRIRAAGLARQMAGADGHDRRLRACPRRF